MAPVLALIFSLGVGGICGQDVPANDQSTAKVKSLKDLTNEANEELAKSGLPKVVEDELVIALLDELEGHVLRWDGQLDEFVKTLAEKKELTLEVNFENNGESDQYTFEDEGGIRMQMKGPKRIYFVLTIFRRTSHPDLQGKRQLIRFNFRTYRKP